jgi:hypothetical protein
MRLCLPRETAGVALEEEAAAWAQLRAKGSSHASGQIRLVLSALLGRVWPRATHPAEHACTLALRARLALGSCSGSQDSMESAVDADLAEAEALLCSSEEAGSSGAWLRARGECAAVRGALALHLAAQARRGSHREAGPSDERSAAPAAANDSAKAHAAGQEQSSTWAHDGRRCEEAVCALVEFLAAADAAAEDDEPQVESAAQLLLQLRWLAGLRGCSLRLQQQADSALQRCSSHAVALEDATVMGLANAPAGSLLGWVLAPHACATLLGSSKASEGPACPPACSLQALADSSCSVGAAKWSAQQLREVAQEAAGQLGKSSNALLQRGLLHLLAASQALRSGALFPRVHVQLWGK